MKVGLTGGIGCGKSTVVQLFKDASWETIETDRVVADLLENDPDTHSRIVSRWGSQVLHAETDLIDRRSVARIVFSNDTELKWLEDLVHPQVRQIWFSALQRDTEANWLVEIPLLYEKRLESHFDLVVCVCSEAALSVKRLNGRGLSSRDIELRRCRQLPLEKKVHQADYVLYNSGSLEFLKRQTLRLIQHLHMQ